MRTFFPNVGLCRVSSRIGTERIFSVHWLFQKYIFRNLNSRWASSIIQDSNSVSWFKQCAL